MTLPVAIALAHSGKAQVQVLGLTTAAPLVKAAGLDLIQCRDLIGPEDKDAISWGEQLDHGMVRNASIEQAEAVAYLGLCFRELVEDLGPIQAKAMFERNGRQAFLPVKTMRRMLALLKPDVLVTTNSPRAERAAVLAARSMGIPTVCMVDLFATDEIRWIAAPDYADSVCVLNESVKRFLVSAGRQPEQIHVTGNPNFDALSEPLLKSKGAALRERNGWKKKQVVLWPCVDEPAVHPFNGSIGDPQAPAKALFALIEIVKNCNDLVLCVRPRPGDQPPELPEGEQFLVTGQDWSLPELLSAVDLVVAMNSTVAVEGHFAGAEVIKLLGSVYDDSMPLVEYGIAKEQVTIDALGPAVLRLANRPAYLKIPSGAATSQVLRIVEGYL